MLPINLCVRTPRIEAKMEIRNIQNSRKAVSTNLCRTVLRARALVLFLRVLLSLANEKIYIYISFHCLNFSVMIYKSLRETLCCLALFLSGLSSLARSIDISNLWIVNTNSEGVKQLESPGSELSFFMFPDPSPGEGNHSEASHEEMREDRRYRRELRKSIL